MKPKPFHTADELFDAMDQLTVSAKLGNLSSQIMGVLLDSMNQLMVVEPSLRNRGLLNQAQSNQREEYRVHFKGKGKLIHGKREIKVELVDMSAQGFGVAVNTKASIANRSNVMLEVASGEGGKDLYSCYVQNCRSDGNGYRIGLKIIDMMPHF